MNPLGLALVALGAFTITGAVMDWNWFMEYRTGRMWIGILGRGGTRILYGLLGIGIMLVGVLLAAGVIQDAR
ncbi:MAG: immunity 17 family protein [Pirellulales bacterium]